MKLIYILSLSFFTSLNFCMQTENRWDYRVLLDIPDDAFQETYPKPSKRKVLAKPPAYILNIPGEILQKILLLSIEKYLSWDSGEPYDNYPEAITTRCNQLAHICKKFHTAIQADPFASSIVTTLWELTSSQGFIPDIMHDAFYFPTYTCYLALVKALLERYKNHSSEIPWDRMFDHAIKFNQDSAPLLPILIAHNPDIVTKDNKLIKKAAGRNNAEALEILVRNGASIKQRGLKLKESSPLHEAVRYHKYHTTTHAVQFLLNHGAPLNVCDQDGLTPLTLAQIEEDLEIIELIKSTYDKRRNQG